MNRRPASLLALLAIASPVLAAACGGGDGGGSPAQRLGVGSECTKDTDCPAVGGITLKCLTAFKGGYCGLANCTKDADCPGGSVCVTEGTTNYCFLVCTDKTQCNYGRTPLNESNCSANVTLVDPNPTVKACVPPS